MTANKSQQKIHDSFIKQMMSDPKVSREFLKVHLPVNIKENVDLNTLQPQKESFIEKTLGINYVDLLFKVNFGDEEGYIYIILEQQSQPDWTMALRLHKYVIQIYSNHMERHPEAKRIPIVYPLVFYTGKARYNAPLTLWELSEKPDLAKLLLIEPFRLIELHKIEDDELRKHLWSGTMAFIMKHIFARDILPSLEAIASLLKEIGDRDFIYIEKILWYVLEKAESSSVEKVIDFFKEIVPKEKRGEIMTLGEQLIEKGRAEALKTVNQIALEKLQEGEKNKAITVAKKMLAEGFDINKVAKITDLSVDELKALLH